MYNRYLCVRCSNIERRFVYEPVEKKKTASMIGSSICRFVGQTQKFHKSFRNSVFDKSLLMMYLSIVWKYLSNFNTVGNYYKISVRELLNVDLFQDIAQNLMNE